MLLTIPNVTKGTAATVALSKSDLFAVASIQADQYFSVQANVRYALFVFQSDQGLQKEVLKFDLSKASPTASFLVSEHARGSFLLERVVLQDFDGGILVVEKAQLPAQFSVSFAPAAPANPLSSLSVQPTSWFRPDAISQAGGSLLTAWSSSVGSATAIESAIAGTLTAPSFISAAQNGLPTVRFAGNQSLKITGRSLPRPSTIVVTYKITDQSAQIRQRVFGLDYQDGLPNNTNASNYLVGPYQGTHRVYDGQNFVPTLAAHAVVVGKWAAMIVVNSDTETRLHSYIEGGSEAQSTKGPSSLTFPFSNMRLGGTPIVSENFYGDLGDVMLFDTALSEQDRTALIALLRTRWGI